MRHRTPQPATVAGLDHRVSKGVRARDFDASEAGLTAVAVLGAQLPEGGAE